MEKSGQLYFDFDTYLRQGEPSQREKAMVRYVYKNNEGVMPEPKYLERFFRNLLLGEQWDLRNRYLVIKQSNILKRQL